MAITDHPICKGLVNKHKNRLKPIIRHKLFLKWLPSICNLNLSVLAMIFGTDKLAHGYIPRYESLLSGLRNRKLNMLEIGIGGYKDPHQGGESLRMWKAYFPRVNVHGLDIYDKSGMKESRIRIWQGSQIDEEILNRIVNSSSAGLDIIIDDGSHRNEHIISTFEILFPRLNKGGWYFVEDTQTSYWPEYGGKTEKHDNTESTAMGYFKNLVDGLNHEELKIPDYQPTYFDINIDSIFFWHNLIAIHKSG